MSRRGKTSQTHHAQLSSLILGSGLVIVVLVTTGCSPGSGGGSDCRTFEKRCADDIVQVCGDTGMWVSTTSCNTATGERCVNGACESTQPDPITPQATCGNGRCEAGENAATCADCRTKPVCGDGRCDSTLGENTSTCPTDCKPPVVCGDGKMEASEKCDGADFGSQSCTSLGLKDGSLACNANCTLDLSGCGASETAACGDGVVSGTENCDGSLLDGKTCKDFGHTSGTLTCNTNCTFDYSKCVTVAPVVCGDAAIGDGEQCDGANLAGQTCASKGFNTGMLKCSPTCTFDQSGCSNTTTPPAAVCGNGNVEANEQCDGPNLDGQTCISKGFNTGMLKCSPTCTFDQSGCSNTVAPPPTTTILQKLGNGVEIISSATKSSGHTIVVGEFLGASASVGGKTVVGAAGTYTGFVAKLDPSGAGLWATALAGRPSSVAVNSLGDVYVLRQGPSGSAVVQYFGLFTGMELSSTEVKSSGTVEGTAVVATATQVYITGRFTGIASAGAKLTIAAGADDILVAAFNWDLTSVKWLKSFGSTGIDAGSDLALDTNSTSLYVTGKFSKTVEGCTSKGDTDIFIAALDLTNGKVKTFDCHGSASYDEGLKIVHSPGGKTHLMGYHNGPATIVDGGSITFNVSLTGSGYFLARINLSNGYVSWAKNTAGFTGRALGVDSQGQLLLCGQSGLNIVARRYSTFGSVSSSQTMNTTSYGVCRGLSYEGSQFRVVGNFSGTASLPGQELAAPMTSGFFWSFE